MRLVHSANQMRIISLSHGEGLTCVRIVSGSDDAETDAGADDASPAIVRLMAADSYLPNWGVAGPRQTMAQDVI